MVSSIKVSRNQLGHLTFFVIMKLIKISFAKYNAND